MTLNERIIAVVTPIVPVCVPDLLVTEAGETPPEEYCTFNFPLEPEALADDTAQLQRALVQLHYFAPLKTNTVPTRRALWAVLAAAEDFSPALIENATDHTGQHYVFEFDAVGRWLGDERSG
uniref:Uncharacterized protein n=1 Tax=Siphoviridae sp. ctrAT9 TaxID=2825686 RepID=A0A8S5QIE7_9CAUD|nr:MAG TPA: hypothetical protein [Siphoviridae sp. ctrAT9]